MLSGCVSFQPGPSPTHRTFDLINTGAIEEIVGQCSVPMVYDGELLLRRSDIRTVFGAFRRANVVLIEERIISETPVTDSSWTTFADTYEMEVYFGKYVPDEASIVEVDTDIGRVTFLLGETRNRMRTILGVRVAQ